jgi:hypothetical protein
VAEAANPDANHLRRRIDENMDEEIRVTVIRNPV